MKKIFSFGRKKKDPTPGSTASARPAGAYELNEKDLSKLHRGAAAGDLAQVRRGLKKDDIDERDKAQRTPLHLACANGHADVVTFLVENKCKLNLLDSDSRSPLMKAVQCQQEKCVSILLEHGADPNLADAGGNTALHLAALAPNAFLAGMLIEHNARINAQNKDGCTPLTLAISEHHEEMVELLLKKGADVHARDLCERTPLMTAASGGEFKLVKVLLRYGADIFHKDVNGWTAEDYAIIHGYSSLSKQLAEYADRESTGEACAGATGGIPVPMTPQKARAGVFTLGAPALSREAMDDISQGDSTRSEKEGSNDSWHTSEEEELDFTAKKPQKPNLTMLMNVPQKFRNNGGGDCSRSENPKSQKKSLKQKEPTGANLNRGECRDLLKQDVSDSSNLEEEEEVEEDEDDDEDDDGDDDEEEEDEEDLTQDEKEEDDLADEESQSNNIMEEEQRGKIELKEEVDQKLGYLSNVENEGNAQCGAGSVSTDSQKILKKTEEKIEESVDTPVSFIDGRYERLQENVTDLSPTRMNNEVSYESVPKQAVVQNINNLHDERCNKKSMIQKIFHRNTASCFADSETTGLKNGIPQPLSNSGDLREKKSRFRDSFQSRSGSWSAAESLNLENQRPSSVMDDEDAEEGQCKEKESPKWNEEEEQEKEVTGRKLQTAVLGGMTHSVCSNKHQVCKASEDTANKRSGLPAVGAEQEEESESPWDSEPGSDSPRKASPDVLLPAADEHEARLQRVSGEQNNGALPAVGAEQEEESESPWDSEPGSDSPRKASPDVLLPAADEHEARLQRVSGEQNNGGLPAVGAEQEEESESPWDSEPCSDSPRKASPDVLCPAADEHGARLQSVSGEHNNGFSEKPSNLQLKVSAVLEMTETSSKKERQKSDLREKLSVGGVDDIEGECSESIIHVSSSAEKEMVKDASANYGRQDKYVLETTNLIENTAHEKQTDKVEISHQEALAENEESHSADKQLNLKPWEERYERMWVEKEKRELKTNFKSITAELKQLFGEINESEETTSIVAEVSGDDFKEELKSFCVSSCVTESSNKLESKNEFGDVKLNIDLKEPNTEIVVPSLGVLPDHKNLSANVEITERIPDEEGCTNYTDNTKAHLAKVEETEENENGIGRNVEGSPEYSLRHCLKTNILDDISNILPQIRPISTNDDSTLGSVSKKKTGKDICLSDSVSRDCLIKNEEIGETGIENLFPHAQQPCGMLERNLDEELKQDVERFKSKVGMLQMVFLALEKEKVQLQKEVEQEKRKQKHFKMQAVEKQEGLDKSDTPAGNITHQPVKAKLTLRKNEKMIEEKHTKNSSSEERPKLLEMPVKGKSVLNAKDWKKNENKRQSSKQKANWKIRVMDDSTSSEASQDEKRPTTKTGRKKNKVSMQMDVTDDTDSTRSSDTTTEDAELLTSTYKEAMLLLEQLSLDCTDPAILLKIQNILLEYEQRIDRERSRNTALWREVRKLESEKEESRLIAEESEDLKSILSQQEMELKNDIQSLEFSLKQEEEKRRRAEMQYEKTREQLKRKEDQYARETEEKQQLELRARNLETELITLRQLKKQVEEERDEAQRQLSQEKSARALQEGILSNHLLRQKELEEETRKTMRNNSEESDPNDREKDLLHRNQLLQEEIAMLRLELDQVKLGHQEDEGKYLEENESLKEKNDDLQKELKLSEEILTQTVFQYNGQLNLLKAEFAMLTSKLEQKKESKDRLETEIESFHSRLNAVVQDLKCHQSLRSDPERTFQRERDEWLRLQDKLHHELSDVRDSNKSLSQQLSKMERKGNSLENELHQLKETLQEKTLLLEMTQKDLNQAQCQAKENEHARQIEKDQVSKFMIKQESMQERLAQLQSENLLLRQQLEDLQNKGTIKEKVMNDVQDRLHEMFNKLRADCEKQVYLMEERNKELNTKCTDLREQVFKYETDKVEREGVIRQLQQELADALKKQSMSEASLEVTTRYRSDLEEDKLRLQKELDRMKTKLQESEEQRIQSEHCVHDLKTVLDSKEREVSASTQKLQDLLLAASGTSTTIKQLEEHVQRLEIENARLEAAAKQQTKRIEALQKDMQASASVHDRLEDLITGLRTVQTAANEYQHQQMQNQNMLAMASKDSRMMWEEELKSRAHLEGRLAQLSREKAELLEQCENERKKVKKLIELKRPVEARLDQEMERNTELQKECHRYKRLLNRAGKKLRMHEAKERESQFNFQGEMKNRYSEMVNEVGKLRTKVTELSQQLDLESKKCIQLEGQNQDLREELSALRGNHEKLEKSKCQLEEEVANLRHHLEANMVTRNQIEQYKKEMEERAGQEIRQKLQEVNLFLQTQAASQDRLEQIRDSHHTSLRNQLKRRIKDLEFVLDRIKNTQDNIFQKESMQAEVEKYKELHREEMKIRKSLANKLKRTSERLAEANAKLLEERHRSKSLIASSIVNGGLSASPGLYSTELGYLGNSSSINRSLSLGGCFLDTAGNALSSRNKVEVYMGKIQKELDEKISKELEQATAELETGSARASPMVSTDGSSKNLNIDQDPLCRAVQEYRDVLNQHYLI
ncbi:uncharacterized protein [Excalfactoria chinensis]|uniref:uncharacterized protein isoform X6 n=1 Tax=Excalfactoria chinensis TaxID=46218 RepID=UPI003B3B127F